MIIPWTEALSETWLLERTYHAQLQNGSELSVPTLTKAMKQMLEFSAPLPAWKEVSQEEAQIAYQQGTPILLYGEHPWELKERATRVWGPNKHMRALIFGNEGEQPEPVSGIDYAVCYLDRQQGNTSNATWNRWFASAFDAIFAGIAPRNVLYLSPCVQFPYTTHYTVIASDGHVCEYASRAEAIQGFQFSLPREESSGTQSQMTFPQFDYYQEVTCPGGVYRITFFGTRMDEPGCNAEEATAFR